MPAAKRSAAVSPEELCAAMNPRVLTAGYYRAAPGYRYLPDRPRISQFYFWYVAAGCGRVRIDGQWIDLARGDFLLLSPGRRYQEERADAADPSRIYFSYLDPFGRRSPRLAAALAHLLPLRLPCPAQARAETLFAELLETYTVGAERQALRLKLLALKILDLVLASLGAHAAPMDARHRDLVQRAQEFIERHVAAEITPEEIAEHVGASASHVFALFHRHVGRSPIRYQTDLRLRVATRELLRGRSVTATARIAGFTSLHYFSRLFKSRHGLAPSEFARQVERK